MARTKKTARAVQQAHIPLIQRVKSSQKTFSRVDKVNNQLAIATVNWKESYQILSLKSFKFKGNLQEFEG